jgi:predicted GNAT family N-acyltransferase
MLGLDRLVEAFGQPRRWRRRGTGGDVAFEVDRVTTASEMAAGLAVRTRVFVEEQHVPIEEEVDRHDDVTAAGVVHFLGRLDGVPIATARLLLETDHGGYSHIGRVAVLAEHRGRGHGRAVMEALHREARALGCAGVTLAAQTHALGFYERLGYVARGPVYLDAGIEHRDMDLRLAP